MGRTLDTLKHGDTPRPTRIVPPVPPPADAARTECVVDWTLQEEVPFIEVGGPGKSVEVSPLLVKHSAQTRVQPPHPPLARELAASTPAAINMTDARPMAVAFEAWPGPAMPTSVAAEIIAYHKPEHAISQAYAALLDKMLQNHAGPGPHVLLLTGLRPRVGTSTVLLNLAAIAARLRHRVAVIDVNLARPALAARLGHAAPGGVQEVLAGSTAIGPALVLSTIPGLHLLPAGGASKNSIALTSEAVAWLATWLRDRFDLILLDAPCLEDAATLAALASHADGVYLVLPQDDADRTTRGIAQAIARMGGRLCGLIHTHFEA